MIKYQVPATTANLGIGFDCLGMALNIYDYFEVEYNDAFNLNGFISDSIEDNLFIHSYKKACEYKHDDIKPIKVKCIANVPVSRGLGSSSCMIVGGIYAYNILNNNCLSKEEMLEIATEIEGHPDNIAPCIYGGLCVSSDNETLKLKVSNKWHFGVFIPPYEVRTEDARKVIKSNIDRNDAVSNIANAIKTIYALEHFDKKHILSITKDRIHEPYRKPLIKDFNNFQSTALKAGALALVISGSGSTCLTVSDKRLDIDEYFQNVKVDKEGVKCLKSS